MPARPLSGHRPPAALSAGAVALAALLSCALPLRRAAPGLAGPPSLRVDFDSESASARLVWERPAVEGFVRYEVERSTAEGYEVIARIADGGDTTHADAGLQADRSYRYRVTCLFAGGDEGDPVQRLESTTVEGGIHRFVSAWPLSDGFLPTRIAVDAGGLICAVGAGHGRVERFDAGGRAAGAWTFTSEPLACLGTGALDGPALAVDDDGDLYVVYNTRAEGQPPKAQWSKLGRGGQLLWTRPLATVFARHVAIAGRRIIIEGVSQRLQFDTDGELVERGAVPPSVVAGIGFWKGAFAALVAPQGLDAARWQAPRLVLYRGVERGDVERVLGRDPLSAQDRGAGLLSQPCDFAVDEATDRAFVVNAGFDRIEVFRGGGYLTRWGNAGTAPASFRFRGVATVVADATTGAVAQREVVAGGIARDRAGFLFVADTFNNRIQKFAP